MQFAKMHGLGNDFIVFDDREKTLSDLSNLSKTLCDRRTGIGADGMILVQNSLSDEILMRIFNSDGSEAEMCGNGIRCFAKYVYDHKIVQKDVFKVETLAGTMQISLAADNGKVSTVTVNLGKPELTCEKIPVKGTSTCLNQKLTALGREFTFSTILLGVPHTVVFTDSVTQEDVLRYGPIIETLPLFPKKTNVNFTKVLDRENIAVRTWERGCGMTLACGTGTSSAAVCCALSGFTGRKVNAHLALGALFINWADDDNVYMTGPAATVYKGEIDISRFLK